VLPLDVCVPCLRRTHLLGLLAPRIERAGRGRAAFGGLLALEDEDLVAALGARNDRNVHLAREAFEADGACDAIVGADLGAVCRHGSWYPTSLLDLGDAPAVLHVAGDPGLLADLRADDGLLPAVAVVGARRATPYGLDVAGVLGRGLAAAGITVVSGMALGIDSAAHAGALEAAGPTIAVLAGGADRPYPASKRALYGRITADGCVVSELPPGAGVMKWAFPARNRIIAGLAAATVVVEAQERSGSLITAEIAADLGRHVGAVPGLVTGSRSAGTNALLHDGAAVVRDVRDALELTAIDVPVSFRRPAPRPPTVPVPARPAMPPPPADPELRRALEAVDDGATSPGRLARVFDGDVARAAVALTRLELAGLLRRELDGSYARRAGT
jgi:DNA processing protein